MYPEEIIGGIVFMFLLFCGIAITYEIIKFIRRH